MVEKGELILVARIYPNRLNPNEMKVDDFIQLKKDVRDGNYDPIKISPLEVFYTPEARMDPRVMAVIPMDADGSTTYIISDGFHRHKAAKELGHMQIRALIMHQTELDAMPYFWRRHKLRGEMDPIKEAELFRHEMDVRDVTWAELAEIYNLSGENYIKTRLALLNVTMDVVELFYKPPEGVPGKLSVEHLRSISFVPKNMQFAVAMMSLDRNWRVEDIRAEVKRIRAGKGLRSTDGEGLEVPPGSYPTTMQRYLHTNIDRLLKPNEERVVRSVKKLGEATGKEIAEDLGIGVAAVNPAVKSLCSMDVLDFRRAKGGGRGKGKPARIFRLWVAKEQPKSEYVRETPLTDEELLKQYPEVYAKTTSKKRTTIKEKTTKPKRITIETKRPEPEGPDAWRERIVHDPLHPKSKGSPQKLVTPQAPPMVLNQELIEDYMEAVYNMAISEGLNVKSKALRDGQTLWEWMEDEIEEELKEWRRLREVGKRDFRNLVAIGLRACQLFTRHREIS